MAPESSTPSQWHRRQSTCVNTCLPLRAGSFARNGSKLRYCGKSKGRQDVVNAYKKVFKKTKMPAPSISGHRPDQAKSECSEDIHIDPRFHVTSLILTSGTAFGAYRVWFPGCIWCPAFLASVFRLTCGGFDQLTDMGIESGIELADKSKAQVSHFGFHLRCNDWWQLANLHPGRDLIAEVINDAKPAVTTGKASAHRCHALVGVAVTKNIRVAMAEQVVKILSHGVHSIGISVWTRSHQRNFTRACPAQRKVQIFCWRTVRSSGRIAPLERRHWVNQFHFSSSEELGHRVA